MSYFRDGYLAYPTARDFPTRDQHSAKAEKQYLKGWHQKGREIERAKLMRKIYGENADFS